MRINFIIPFLSLTGGLKIIFEYATRLKENGDEIKIYVPCKPYREYYDNNILWAKNYLKNVIKGNNIDWIDLDIDVIMVPNISEKFIDDADVVVATAWPTAYDVEKLSEKKGGKVYFIQDYEIWHGQVDKVEATYLFDMKQIVIAKWLKELVESKNGNREVELIYNGIDLDEMYNNEKEYKIKSKNVIMLYHELESKGVKDGISIINNVRKKYTDINLIMFGIGRGEGIPKYAEFYHSPNRNEIRKIYSRGDVFLFTSISEGWGLTPLEAMACKCAVVGRNVGAIKEVGEDGINVLKSQPSDLDALERNLIKVLNDIDLREKLSEEGCKLVAKFDWCISVDKFKGVLYNALNRE